MTVRTLGTPYQTATEKSHIKNWLNMTVGLRVDTVNSDDDGATKSLGVTVFTADDTETGEPCRIESSRIIGQIVSAGVEVGDVLVTTIVPMGQRGQVLGVPADKDKAAEVIRNAFSPDE